MATIARFAVAESGAIWLTQEDLVLDGLGFLSQHLVILLDEAVPPASLRCASNTALREPTGRRKAGICGCFTFCFGRLLRMAERMFSRLLLDTCMFTPVRELRELDCVSKLCNGTYDRKLGEPSSGFVSTGAFVFLWLKRFVGRAICWPALLLTSFQNVIQQVLRCRVAAVQFEREPDLSLRAVPIAAQK